MRRARDPPLGSPGDSGLQTHRQGSGGRSGMRVSPLPPPPSFPTVRGPRPQPEAKESPRSRSCKPPRLWGRGCLRAVPLLSSPPVSKALSPGDPDEGPPPRAFVSRSHTPLGSRPPRAARTPRRRALRTPAPYLQLRCLRRPRTWNHSREKCRRPRNRHEQPPPGSGTSGPARHVISRRRGARPRPGHVGLRAGGHAGGRARPAPTGR